MKSSPTFLAVALGLVGLAARGTMAATATTAIKYETDAIKIACYKSGGSLSKKSEDNSMSMGICRGICVEKDVAAGGKGYAVFAMTGPTECYCGNKLPNSADKVDDSKCNSLCPGNNNEACGDRYGEYLSVWTTGLETSPSEDETRSSSSASSTKSQSPSTTSSSSAPAATTSTTENKKESSGVNKGAVAAGVVVGVLVVLAVGVGAWLLIRKRNRERVEEEYRRSAAAREYASKPNSDHRLDPGMVQRRDSVGSIADNQDYSRRILKVTNPDG